ncbi:MAG: MBL fold metallo-hydrolase [Bacteroidota bacterium]|nr:MBL fold metallo-hydrolase [Bacteroidota bacterium]
MSIFITSLNSGSNGNCYFIGNDQEAVLVDVGISCREIERRMLRLGLSMNIVKAIFISHEHADHIRGVVVLARKYQLPVYITPSTLKNSPISLEKELVRSFIAHQPVTIGGLSVTAFLKFHDASEPHSFIVEGNGVKIGVFTDIGTPCEQLIHYFKQCNAAFLEANYDGEMLEKGRYPFSLKKRITGGNGHLSNKQALDLFIEHQPVFMTHLILSHLSKDNNCPQLVYNLFRKHAKKDLNVVVASRFQETSVYTITNNNFKDPVKGITAFSKQPSQMTLF